MQRFYCQREPIAIVGIGCRFPGGADSPEAFWQLLSTGADAITEIPPERWNWQAFADADPKKPGSIYSRWGGFLPQIDQFDAAFFGISPREAAVMDPQQRLLLEVAWEALEDGGLVAEELDGSRTGVFIGISSQDYANIQGQATERRTSNAYIALGNTFCIAANRISYALNLRGPSFAVDIACSSSLVAMHLACESLWRGESILALVGGVNLIARPEPYINFCNASMLSPDGRCRSFDARANGYVRAEGAGVVVLKPLTQARRDGNSIYALVLSSAVNQDGRTPGITVPSGEAQETLLREAYGRAGISPAQLQYIEAHGTGMPVGDPIEAEAIGKVVGQDRAPGDPCLMGSVKSNIGHLEAGAGIAGVIKVALALTHEDVPATLHFQEPNPKIDLDRLRLRVPKRPEPWPRIEGRPRFAGINSFGFGGTNAHVVLAEAPASAGPATVAEPAGLAQLVPISARSPEALRTLAGRYREQLIAHHEVDLRNLAYSAAVRRSHHPLRLAVVAHNRQQLVERLEAVTKGEECTGVATGRVLTDAKPRLAFVFTGMGPQWWAMGRQLLVEEPVFRDALAECDALFRSVAGWSILEELTTEENRSRIQETKVAQPAIFALQVALAALWGSWGVEPEAVVGHSVGEAAAAYVAGAISLPDAVRVIFNRSRLQHSVRGQGGMLAMGLPVDEIGHLLDAHRGRVDVAAVNSPRAITLSGDAEALRAIARVLEPSGAFCRPLQVEVPYHGPQMEPLKEPFLRSLAGMKSVHPPTALFSTVTGADVNGTCLDGSYWWSNLREPVRFARAMQALLACGLNTFLEVGPHPVLAGSIRDCAAAAGKTVTVLTSLLRKSPERATMLETLGQLYTRGYPIAWSRLHPDGGRLVKLPPYPWQRDRYWRESEDARQVRLGTSAAGAGGILGQATHLLLGRRVLSAHTDPIWHTEIDLQREHSWLADHVVQGTKVYPAAAFAEMALAAGAGQFGAEPFTVEELECHKPLFLTPGETRRLQLVVEGGQNCFEIFSQESSGAWVRHAAGRLHRGPTSTAQATVPIEEIRARCPYEMGHDEWYSLFSEVGLDYGPLFRGIERLWCAADESLARIKVPDDLTKSIAQYHLHPAILDACFQALAGGTLVEGKTNGRRGRLYLPQQIDRLRLWGRLAADGPPSSAPSILWSHVRVVERDERFITVDIQILDDHGTVLADIRRLRCQAIVGTRPADNAETGLYEHRWQIQTRTAEHVSDQAPGTWLIFADQQGVGDQLAALLQQRGESPLLIRLGKEFKRRANSYTIRVLEAEDMHQLIADIVSQQTRCRGIVHLWSLDAPPVEKTTPASLETAMSLGSLNALQLVQACAGAAWAAPPRLWLVTRGTQAVGGMSSLAVAQSPLWGLGRVIVNEQPDLHCSLVDLGDGSQAELQTLCDELRDEDNEVEIALRGGERYVHRLVPVTPANVIEAAQKTATGTAPQMQRPFRLQIATPGLLDSLTLRSISRRSPGPGEVEIEVRAAGLNFKDVVKAMNVLSDATLEGTLGGRELGAECAGVIRAVGPGVGEFRKGDEVVALARAAFSRFVTTAGSVVNKPKHLSFEQAASLPVVFLTAHYALNHLAQMRAGERVLIHAASGGVGLAAVQLAQRAGAEIFATAGSPEKRDFLRSLGVRHVMDSRSLDFADQILELTAGEGVDIVLNSLMGEALLRSLSLLRTCGRFIELGKRDIEENGKLGLRPFQKHLSFFAIDLDRLGVVQPQLMRRLLGEVMRAFEERTLEPLPYRVFPISQASEAFQHVARARHIGKVVLSLQDPNAVPVPSIEGSATFQSDATYLIVGGLGGFGLATARWLVSRGVRHLVLMGREGAASAEAKEAVRSLEQVGAKVVVAAADVTREDDLARVLAEVRKSLPPLRGVFHTAMVLDDGILDRLTPARFQTVLAPKVLGAWNLHRLTADDPLDCFVLFSSVSAVVGNRGQGSYAAANLFLDTLARHRRAQGLPALSVNWTAVADVGYLARNPHIREHLAHLGLEALPAEELLKTLGQLLHWGAAQTAVMRFDGTRWAQQFAAGTSPRFSPVVPQGDLGRAGTDGASSESTLFTGRSEEAGASERQALIAARVREHVCKVLGIAAGKLDADRPLIELGLDSLMAVELSTRIKKDFSLDLALMKFMQGLSATGLIAEIQKALAAQVAEPAPPSPTDNGAAGTKVTTEAVDWKAEMTLDPAITVTPDLRLPVGDPSVPLLTGVTGFLGSFLLYELLQQSDWRIYCLVRCRNAEQGLERIRQSMETYLLWDPCFAARIVAVPGDLTKPRLGLAPDVYRKLAEEIDVIYHNGANVDLLQPYAPLRPSNVQGTQEVLSLACRGQRKQVHFISSLGVFDLLRQAHRRVVREVDVPAELDSLRYGYEQTKAVAEHLVREAGVRGIPIVVYRPGLINACSATGAYTTQDMFSRLLKSWVDLQLAPNLDRDVLITPVDYVSRAVVYLSRQTTSIGKTFHLSNSTPVRMSALADMVRASGYPLEIVAYDRWQAQMAKSARESKDQVLSGIIPFLTEETSEDPMPLWPPRNVQFDCRETFAALEGGSIACPPVDTGLVQSSLEYFRRTGFIRKYSRGRVATLTA
jgi:thioester reductase-like protein